MCFTLLQGFLLQLGGIHVKIEPLGMRRAEASLLDCLQNSELAPRRHSEDRVVLWDFRSNLEPGLWFKNIFKLGWWDILCCQMFQGIGPVSGFLSLEVFFLLLGIFEVLVTLGRFSGITVERGEDPSSTLGWHQICNLLSPSAGSGSGPALMDVHPLG